MQGDRAVAADPVVATGRQGLVDDRAVDRVQDDDGVVLHPQRGGGVDPVPIPARRAQLGEDLGRVVAALGRDDDRAALELLDVIGVLQGLLVLGLRGAAPPALEVEKNSGSIRSKSRSAVMRSMSTEPTMPRQPTRPTRVVIVISFRRTSFTKPAHFGPGSFAGSGGRDETERLALDGFNGGDGGGHGVAHFAGRDLRGAFTPDVGRAQP